MSDPSANMEADILVAGAGAAPDNLLGAGGTHRRLDRNDSGNARVADRRHQAMVVSRAGSGRSEIVVGGYPSLAPQMSSAASKGIVSS